MDLRRRRVRHRRRRSSRRAYSASRTSACSRPRSSAVGFFQIAPRSHRRGVSHEVRLPLRRRRRTGGGCVASFGRCCCSSSSEALLATSDSRRACAVRRRDLRRRRRRAGASRSRAPPARAVVRERRRDGAAPAQPLRPAERLPGGLVRAPTARHRHRRPHGCHRGARRHRHRAGDLDASWSPSVGVGALSAVPVGAREGARRGRAVASASFVDPVEHRDRRHLAPHDARSADPRRRCRGRPRSGSSGSRQTPQTGSRGSELAGAPRASDRADARLGEGRAVACARGACAATRGGRARSWSSAVPVFFVAMPWLVRVVFGSEYDGAVHGRAGRALSPRRSTSRSVGRSPSPSRSGGRDCGS